MSKNDSPAGTGNASLPSARARIPSLGEIGLNHFAPYLLNCTTARWNAHLQIALRDTDLSVLKMRALAVLSIMPGLSVGELALFSVSEQSTMSRTLDSMEEQGLIQRSPQKEDARAKVVELTNKGRAVFSEFWPVLYHRAANIFDGVGEDEVHVFLKVLNRIMRNFDQA